MPYSVLKTLALRFRGAILLERLLPHSARSIIISILGFFLLILFVPAIVYAVLLFNQNFSDFLFALAPVHFLLPKLVGLFCIIFALWLLFLMLESFYYSFYFSALDAILNERGINESEPISFGVALLVSHSDDRDLTRSFINSPEGERILFRCGLLRQDIDAFLSERKSRLTPGTFSITSYDSEYGITMADYAVDILKADPEFAQFLFSHGIQEKTFLGAAEWVVYAGRVMKKRERWWSRDSLGRIEGIGKDWAYGEAYTLNRYAKRIFDRGTSFAAVSSNYLHEEVEALEKVLARAEEANALLVGDTTSGPRDVVLSFTRRIQEGKVLPSLAHKRVVFVDTNKLSALNGVKAKFESELIRIMEESIAAGNIIIVFDDFAGFTESAHALGADVLSILDPYISTSRIQVIAISEKSRFHSVLEPNSLVTSRFERILLQSSGVDVSIRVLEIEALSFEARYGILFTYPALEAIVTSAERYVTTGVMPDKAVDLLVELVPAMNVSHTQLITKDDVLTFVQMKTGIPTGKVSEEEKEKLLNLETLLHQRVVGQDEAVSAIANAMRRARSGIGNPNRPMGSFLFLGPTGVGKTETTKALSSAFFGNEDKVIRLDMSEYKSLDAMDKLIGSFSSKSPGVLSTALREHPYGVLLLDEFEKSASEVRDLFLQVLDEGFFSDMSGNRINARNVIIIATSNAGVDMIWEFMKTGSDLMSHKDEVIDSIVKAGIFKPELINRFDGVILFHPIDTDHLREIAKLTLEKFRVQLRDRGIDLEINDALVEYLMTFGTDPKFGARPMNRALQDTIEEYIAKKLINGSLKEGQTLRFTREELALIDKPKG